MAEPARFNYCAGAGAAAAALIFTPALARAHAVSTRINDFYAGFLHPLTAPEHVLPMLALGLLAAQQGLGSDKRRLDKSQATVLGFFLALAGGAVLALRFPDIPGVLPFNLLSAVLFGGLVAAAWRLPAMLLYALAGLFGLSHGYANGSAVSGSISAYLFIPGLLAATLLVVLYSMAGADLILRRRQQWTQIAVRVAGSWIAAIGLLVLGVSATITGLA